MSYTKNILFALSAAISLFSASCSKSDDSTPTSGTVMMHFDNMVGSQTLALNTATYLNSMGDSFTVSKWNYYISNIVLNGASGTASFTEPVSYHLIEAEDANSQMFNITNVPAGTYTSISFMIGVDSLHNVSGAQTGALDPGKGMFWDWNSGYIMFKMEGNAPKAVATGGKLTYHVGGFMGENNTVRSVSLSFASPITVNGNTSHMHIVADLAKALNSPNAVDFSALQTIHMPGAAAKKIADNYAGMFSIMEVMQ